MLIIIRHVVVVVVKLELRVKGEKERDMNGSQLTELELTRILVNVSLFYYTLP